MCLFTKGRNAVIAVLDLAMHEANGPVALPAICERTGLSLSYLENIFRKLRCGGIVLAVRGAHGGFLLARPVEELNVADILLAMDESLVPQPMDSSVGCRTHQNADVAAHELWTTLNLQLIDFLGTVSLKFIIEEHCGQRHRKH